eukprot:GFYU01005323.1.p1 GENE.GFYU01005323.1~~GFYU01005323.1.p1  ORF type:complete len:420 (-),score=133.51 GFYU01005323.1:76-1335(-)
MRITHKLIFLAACVVLCGVVASAASVNQFRPQIKRIPHRIPHRNLEEDPEDKEVTQEYGGASDEDESDYGSAVTEAYKHLQRAWCATQPKHHHCHREVPTTGYHHVHSDHHGRHYVEIPLPEHVADDDGEECDDDRDDDEGGECECADHHDAEDEEEANNEIRTEHHHANHHHHHCHREVHVPVDFDDRDDGADDQECDDESDAGSRGVARLRAEPHHHLHRECKKSLLRAQAAKAVAEAQAKAAAKIKCRKKNKSLVGDLGNAPPEVQYRYLKAKRCQRKMMKERLNQKKVGAGNCEKLSPCLVRAGGNSRETDADGGNGGGPGGGMAGPRSNSFTSKIPFVSPPPPNTNPQDYDPPIPEAPPIPGQFYPHYKPPRCCSCTPKPVVLVFHYPNRCQYGNCGFDQAFPRTPLKAPAFDP